ncbi:hypothetical protein PVAP13_2NG332800 [Panicum virgatum]|uniref:CCHC-type domain-containing protein n=1 Tax=Panicum virgatum TaxID=38727 RepID=A0A8T0VPT2_PANVG|nr:hypothetical protein PVAP13_2NG332800 [Panicum virgatum]
MKKGRPWRGRAAPIIGRAVAVVPASQESPFPLPSGPPYGPPDADGFFQVQSHRRILLRPAKPVPPSMVGKCFNFGSEDHVKAKCPFPPRCLNCGSECHRRRSCPFPPMGAYAATKKRRRSPAAANWREPCPPSGPAASSP